MIENNKSDPFNSQYFSNYYKDYRNKYEDLFNSEKFFFHKFLENSYKTLDIGCASGGMYKILQELSPKSDYLGVDISQELVKIAKKNFPDGKFNLIDGLNLPYEDNSFDGVISFGATVHESNWEILIKEAFRVTRGKLLFDIRFTNKPTINSIDLGYVIDGSKVKYPYIVANYCDFLEYLNKMDNLFKASIYGYFGSSNKDTTLPEGYETIIMSSVLLEKKISTDYEPKLDIKLPLGFFEEY